MSVNTDGTTAGDQNTVCADAERLGRAGKAQTPPALIAERQWRVVRVVGDESPVPTLILRLAAETFPRQAFVGELIEEVVTVVLSPLRSVGFHGSPPHVSRKPSGY
jgi:hypothetical protein